MKWIIYSTIFAVILGLFALWSTLTHQSNNLYEDQKPLTEEQYFEKSRQLFQAEYYNEAISVLNDYKFKFPKSSHISAADTLLKFCEKAQLIRDTKLLDNLIRESQSDSLQCNVYNFKSTIYRLRKFVEGKRDTALINRAKEALQPLLEKRWCQYYNSQKFKVFDLQPGTIEAHDEMYRWYNLNWGAGMQAMDDKDYTRAIELLETAIETREALYGIDDPETGSILGDLGESYYRISDRHNALRTYDRAYHMWTKGLFKKNPKRAAECLVIYQELLKNAGRDREAVTIMLVYTQLTDQPFP